MIVMPCGITQPGIPNLFQLELPFYRHTYQWLANGVPISGANWPWLTIPMKRGKTRLRVEIS
jgi:hypothetical protein